MRRTPALIVLAAGVAALLAAAWFARTPGPLTPPTPAPTGSAAPGPEPRPARGGSIAVSTVDADGPVADVPLLLVNEALHVDIEARTGAGGDVVVESLAGGSWTVFAKHPRYVLAAARAEVEDGRRAVVSILLSSGGRIAGNVTDEAGAPLAGASLSILDTTSRKVMHPSLRATTAADGSFAIAGIPLGPAGILASSPKFRPSERLDLVFARNGETQTVSIRLAAGTTVSGRVVDGAGVPLPDATVSGSNEFTGITRTDAEGRFTVGGLGDKAVNLFAQAPGFGTAYARGVAPGTTGLEIRLLRSATISGRVAASPPPPRFSLLLFRFEADLGRELLVQTFDITTGDGTFEAANVAAGRYFLSIEAPGYSIPSRVEIDVPAGAMLAGIEIPAVKLP